MTFRTSVAAAVLALSVAACSASAGSPERQPSPVPAHRATGALPRLAFFMNPNGVPCQMQDRVLHDMAGELSGRAELVYYRTTEPGDLEWFGRYGVRSLPMLVLTDASGREIRRATPGIQAAEEIRRLVGP
ncbi:MAG TPA: thioredoxin family protein [Anaeromyxobacteraceae bacterium]|nr:thioredoxin family protein [Anaeromyxobacteraceae bacterium]